ncbi:hypothetical protein RFF58_09365 [Streptococcus ruminantium]|nr:hypothetical protein [Streptococcus ruminantium]
MNQEQINQALSLTIQELTAKLADELSSKNLLAVQLTEAQKTIAEMTQQLDEVTKPEEVEA